MSTPDAPGYSHSGSPRQRWALTKEAFDHFLACLDADVEAAGEKYLLMRRNLVRYFEGRGCPLAEDHADEAINRVAKRLAEREEIRDVNGYAYGIARLLLLEIYKEREREKKALTELPSLRLADFDASEHDETEDRLACLHHCLERVASDSKQLIVGYYQGDKQSRITNRKRLAESLGIPNQALRSRCVRIREKLEACLSTCLKQRRARHDTESTFRPLGNEGGI